MKTIYSLVFLSFLCSCEQKKVYHQILDLIWESKNVNWNASSLIVDEDFIYGHTMSDSIFKLDIPNGKIVWKRHSRGTYSSLSPKISENTVLIGGADKLKAFDKKGKLIWSVTTSTKTIGLTLNDSLVINTKTKVKLFLKDIA